MIIFYRFADFLILQTNYQKEWADKNLKKFAQKNIKQPYSDY